jgi:phospholipase/carboxylesterase
MQQRALELAGLEIVALTPDTQATTGVVLLHGYDMDTDDLAPFGSSLRLPVPFFFPRGTHAAETNPDRRAWWPIDSEARTKRALDGGGDLSDVYPPELPVARRLLTSALQSLCAKFSLQRIVLGGFSQGGMLACDVTLRGELPVIGLVLLSTSRLALPNWNPHVHRLRDMPVFVSHGTRDTDLAFHAGEGLRDLANHARARTTWVPFDGGHEIPLPVWRALRTFLGAFV